MGASGNTTGAAGTRERLLETAERLFAERGLDRVSLAEITRESGARNASALQYHFGGREGLIEAIQARHQPGIDAERQALLDEATAPGAPRLQDLVRALVLPVAHKLDDPHGGPAYVRIMSQLIGSPGAPLLDSRARRVSVGRDRLMAMVADALPDLPRPVIRMRSLLVASFLFHALADFARLAEAGIVSPQHRDFYVANLVDALVGLLTAPVEEAR